MLAFRGRPSFSSFTLMIIFITDRENRALQCTEHLIPHSLLSSSPPDSLSLPYHAPCYSHLSYLFIYARAQCKTCNVGSERGRVWEGGGFLSWRGKTFTVQNNWSPTPFSPLPLPIPSPLSLSLPSHPPSDYLLSYLFIHAWAQCRTCNLSHRNVYWSLRTSSRGTVGRVGWLIYVDYS